MSNGLLLAGDLHVGFFNNAGAFLGYLPNPLNATELQLTPGDVDEKIRVSKQRTTAGQALSAVTQTSPWTMGLTIDTQTAETLKMAFLGELADIAESSGSATDEAITARLGNWVPLANRNADSGVAMVVQDDGDTITYVLDTDYSVDFRNGMIKAIEGGAIAEGDVLHVDYTFLGLTGTAIKGALTNTIKTRLLLDGRNLDGNERVAMIIHEVNLNPANGIDILGDDFVSTQFSGTLITPAGTDHPFRYEKLGADS